MQVTTCTGRDNPCLFKKRNFAFHSSTYRFSQNMCGERLATNQYQKVGAKQHRLSENKNFTEPEKLNDAVL